MSHGVVVALTLVLAAFFALPAAASAHHQAAPDPSLVLDQPFDTPAPAGAVAKVYRTSLWTGAAFGNAAGKYSDENLSVHDGVLDLDLRNGVGAYVAFDPTRTGQTYGRYRFRVEVTGPGSGYGVAFLLWPKSDKPSDGELDVLEGTLNSTMKVYHHSMQCEPRPQVEYCGNQVSIDTKTRWSGTGWHDVDVTWVRGSVTYRLDGKTIRRVTESVPSTPHAFILQAGRDGSAAPRDTHLLVGAVTIEHSLDTGQHAIPR